MRRWLCVLLAVLALAGAPLHATIPGNYTYAVAIAKSDGTNYTAVGTLTVADAVYVGGAGVVALVLPDSTVVNFTAVAGEILPVRSIRVNSTNTTATLMVALYYE